VALAHITYGGKEYEIPEGLTPEQALEGLKAGQPELANAKLEKDGKTGNFIAKVNYGRKG
jgi:hypothetical protein